MLTSVASTVSVFSIAASDSERTAATVTVVAWFSGIELAMHAVVFFVLFQSEDSVTQQQSTIENIATYDITVISRSSRQVWDAPSHPVSVDEDVS